MRCANCGNFSFFTFCKNCSEILSDNVFKYRLVDTLKVFYFYNYSDIKNLLHAKHKFHGYLIYKNLAKFSIAKFANFFYLPTIQKIYAIGLDDNVQSGYSHTAILANCLKNNQITPMYSALRAQNCIKYSGQSLEFRKNNPRNFKLLKSIDAPVILVDDIITTGLSMQEAYNCLKKQNIDVLFGIVLADARE